MNGQVLVVDDQLNMCEMVRELLEMHDIETTSTTMPQEALEWALNHHFDAVLTDINMPEMNGIELCQSISQARPDLPVIVMTAFGSLDSSILAIRSGAFDFVTKPFEVDLLVSSVRRAIQHYQLKKQIVRLREEIGGPRSFELLIGESRPMIDLFELMQRVATTDSTILVTGESGTGKELVARSLHEHSRRSERPFVAVNCAALPESLLESELFGHTKGAFTDAHQDKPGLFQRANQGTLFLDEIGEMPLAMQAKLLRVLEESTITPVGATQEIEIDVRVICATNRDLEEEVSKNLFREDLFFRINVIPVAIAPLRSRGNDILLLANHFLKSFACDGKGSDKDRSQMSELSDMPVPIISQPAAQKLLDYDWPGNVRELRNAMERASALARFDQIQIDDLPKRIQDYQSQKITLSIDDPKQILPMAEIEKRYISQVLAAAKGNKTLAAKLLGFDRTTLYRKMDQYQLEK